MLGEVRGGVRQHERPTFRLRKTLRRLFCRELAEILRPRRSPLRLPRLLDLGLHVSPELASHFDVTKSSHDDFPSSLPQRVYPPKSLVMAPAERKRCFFVTPLRDACRHYRSPAEPVRGSVVRKHMCAVLRRCCYDATVATKYIVI